MNLKEMMQKAVNAEAKADLKSSTMIWDSDVHCSRGHRPSHNTSLKMQTEGSKNSSRSKKFKPKDPKPAPSCNDTAEPAKKENKKEKKKRLQKRRREQNKQTPVTSDNTKAPKNNKKRRDPSKITSFNCNKKSHYASNCTKPLKN